MSKRDVDYYEGAVHIDFFKDIVSMETTAEDFNTVLRMRSKIPETAHGLERCVQVMSRPINVFIAQEHHDALLGALLALGVIIVKHEYAPWSDVNNANHVKSWVPFGIRTHRMSGATFRTALEAIALTSARIVLLGDQYDPLEFNARITPFVCKGRHVFDFTTTVALANKDNIPLL